MARMMDKIVGKFPNAKQQGYAKIRLKKLVKAGKVTRKAMRKYINEQDL